MTTTGPIGIFDSGYGGLTILSKIRELLPQYNYLYLGDNARTPYGTRSFEVNCLIWVVLWLSLPATPLRQKPCAASSNTICLILTLLEEF